MAMALSMHLAAVRPSEWNRLRLGGCARFSFDWPLSQLDEPADRADRRAVPLSSSSSSSGVDSIHCNAARSSRLIIGSVSMHMHGLGVNRRRDHQREINEGAEPDVADQPASRFNEHEHELEKKM